MTLLVDGVAYNVHVVYKTLQRTITLLEGQNSGRMLSGRESRDIIGSLIGYAMDIQADTQYPESYDALHEALTEPTPTHNFVVPYGQGTISFEGRIDTVTDVYEGTLAGKERWNGLHLEFSSIAPYKA